MPSYAIGSGNKLTSLSQLPPHAGNKNVVSQIKRYDRWMVEFGRVLHLPDLTTYRYLDMMPTL